MATDRFREVTRRICGSLDLGEALYAVFQYLRTELPLDGIFITQYEVARRHARLIATASNDGGFLVDQGFPLSDTAWEEIREWQEASRVKTTPWIRDHADPINREVVKSASERVPAPALISSTRGEYSSITCALRVQETIIANLTLGAEGAGNYTEAHGDIVTEINEPFSIALSNALRYIDVVRDNRELRRENRSIRGDVMVGADAGLRRVRKLIEQVAPTDSPVLLLGETGTGKEVVATEVYKLSMRSQGPLVRVNCGAIPESLVDSELFGHEKGAFTGAIENKPGRFERANGGTLFLDEIGELPLAAQAKLLRVLQGGEFERVGGGETLKTDVRIVAATHRDLGTMVAEGTFRQDLWYRLNVFPVRIPPLRERKQDIPLLLDYFIRTKAQEMNLGIRPEVAPGAMDRLMAHDWSGNVRELSNLVERALILSNGMPLQFPEVGRPEAGLAQWKGSGEDRLVALDDVIASHIRYVLDSCNGRIAGPGGAAEVLKLNSSTLRSRMRKMGIPFPAGWSKKRSFDTRILPHDESIDRHI